MVNELFGSQGFGWIHGCSADCWKARTYRGDQHERSHCEPHRYAVDCAGLKEESIDQACAGKTRGESGCDAERGEAAASRRTKPRMSARSAPTAIRTPISRLRCATE